MHQPKYESFHNRTNGRDLIHIPSISMHPSLYEHIQGACYYEERSLPFLLHLDSPGIRLVYVTSKKVPESSVEYFLSFLDVDRDSARRRLLMISCDEDESLRSLSEKLLDRPDLISTIREFIDVKTAVVSCFVHTVVEDMLFDTIGLHCGGYARDFSFWGTKCGSRLIFKEAGCPHPVGSYRVCKTKADLITDLCLLVKENPGKYTFLIKLNEGVSGLGNAMIAIPQNSFEGSQTLQDYLHANLESIVEPCSCENVELYMRKVEHFGAIIEEFLPCEGDSSPSVQGVICSEGAVQVVSTHEQVLEKQVYKGCLFPARDSFRSELQKWGAAVGACLAKRGCIDEYGVDFIVREDSGRFDFHALEINLRQLGTTHPMLALCLLTKGWFCKDGTFKDRNGQLRCYMATENLILSCLIGLKPDKFYETVRSDLRLQFNKEKSIGTIFYMWSCLEEFGKIGLVCVGSSRQEAYDRMQNVTNVLIELLQ